MTDLFHVYVDFDSTLFDTWRFGDDLRSILSVATGLSPEQIRADQKNKFTSDPNLGGYEFEAHVLSYGLEPTVLWRCLSELTTQNDYLFPDSVAFITKLRTAGFDPQILSFGEARFQEAKIKPTLSKLAGRSNDATQAELQFVVVYRPKREHLAELHPSGRGVLVDDKPDQQLPVGFYEITLDRSRDLVAPLPKAEGCTVSNLAQAYQVVRSLYDRNKQTS